MWMLSWRFLVIAFGLLVEFGAALEGGWNLGIASSWVSPAPEVDVIAWTPSLLQTTYGLTSKD